LSPRHLLLAGSRPGLRAVAILSASGLTLFGMAGVSPALPAIARAFADVPNIGLLAPMVLTMAAFFIALSAPFAGLVIDRLGRRPVLVTALAVYLVSGLAPIFLDGLSAILASRAIMGVAVGMILTVATTLIGDFYDGAARNRMAGLQFATMTVAMAFGTTVTGFLAESDWRLPFAMYALALVVLPLAWLAIEEPVSQPRDESSVAGNLSESGRGESIAVGALALVYALVWLSMVFTFFVPSQVPFLLPEIGVPEARIAGFGVALFNLVTGITAVLFRLLRGRFGRNTLMATGNILLGCGYLLAASADGASQVLAGMVVSGLGFGIIVPTLNAWLLSVAPVRLRGRVVGGFTFCQFLGLAVSPFYSRPVAALVDMTGAFALTGLGLIALALGFAGAGMMAFALGGKGETN
jgi:MFS family permease